MDGWMDGWIILAKGENTVVMIAVAESVCYDVSDR